MTQITATEAKREYMRKWRAENKDKIAAAQRRYWERQAEKANRKEVTDNGRYSDNSAGSTAGTE